ncbi:MAG: SDR family NAD(P)-dependent oxidoreductase [Veillonella sp.]|nr:SDR family NAD(P)-dependent oxidoreductase [Veillonella sp.]
MNRKIFVTGATSGIGLECARAFAQDGDNVLIAGRRADRLAAIKEDFEQQYGIRVDTLVLDVSKREDVDAKVKPAIEAFGGIDVLVNNAGLAQGLDPFQDSTVEDAVTMINTNVLGLLYVTKAVLPFMIDNAVYCATKAAVKMLADGIRMDTIATDIKVTTIQPGIVETPFSEVRFHGDAERAKSVYAGIEAVQPEDVADVVLYVTNQPKRMQISDVTIMANQQAAGFMVHKK